MFGLTVFCRSYHYGMRWTLSLVIELILLSADASEDAHTVRHTFLRYQGSTIVYSASGYVDIFIVSGFNMTSNDVDQTRVGMTSIRANGRRCRVIVYFHKTCALLLLFNLKYLLDTQCSTSNSLLYF